MGQDAQPSIEYSVTVYGVNKIYDQRTVERYESARQFAAEGLAGLRGRSEATVDDRVDAEALLDNAIRQEKGAHLDVRLGEGVKITCGVAGPSRSA